MMETQVNVSAGAHWGDEVPPGSCRVCRNSELGRFACIDGKDYWHCNSCEAVFLDEACLPNRVDEHTHYCRHENDVNNPRYRAFVSRLGDPLLQHLKPGSEGLDYGCGPGPALAAILCEHGHAVSLYDPFFHTSIAALARQYDFVICCEVAEHFHQPHVEFARLDKLLRPGGFLGLMTSFRANDRPFANWHYRHDPTHVVFYREATLRSIAARFGWTCEVPRKDVAIMRKPGGTI